MAQISREVETRAGEERGLESCLTWKEVHGGRAWRCQAAGGLGGWQPRCGVWALDNHRRGLPAWSAPAASTGTDGALQSCGLWSLLCLLCPRDGRAVPGDGGGCWASPPLPGLDPGPAGFWTLVVTRRYSKLGRGTRVTSSQRPSGPRWTTGLPLPRARSWMRGGP